MQVLRKLKFLMATASTAFMLLTTSFINAGTIQDYFPSFPYIGLATEEVTYGPITVSRVHINNGEKLAMVSPGEVLHGSLHYQVDSSSQEMLLLKSYHLVIGLKGKGAEKCIVHTHGVWDSKGKAEFTLQAPYEPGVYEVRFLYHEAPNCKDAEKLWDLMGEPSSSATIGVIIVEAKN